LKDQDDLERLCKVAVEKGVEDARIIHINEIVVRNWVYWKCRFGCSNYGKNLMCPPHSPHPEETRALLKEYEYAILLKMKSEKSKGQSLLIELEREAFLGGHYSALGLTSGSCKLCETCNVDGGSCIKSEVARPSMESSGIDVFSTAQNVGFSMKVLSSKDQEWYRFALLLIM
jgi:predicted metal-binding protein